MGKAALPECGRHEHGGWTVVRDGFYGVKPRRRQRYRCVDPTDRDTFHRFTPAVMRLEAEQAHCLDCESPLNPGQGPNAARYYGYAAREIAQALTAVATGSTYEQAALTARRAVIAQVAFSHPRERNERTQVGQLFGAPSSHGTLVASWVETYTDVVLGGTGTVPMPEVLLLDSTSFWRRSQGQHITAFHVLCAYGYAAGEEQGRLLRAVTYPLGNTDSWTDFLAAMPGMPAVIVADRAQEIRAAIRSRWPLGRVGQPRPEVVDCRWHLANRLRKALAADLKAAKIDAPDHALMTSAGRAFDSLDSWELYRLLALPVLDRIEQRIGKESDAARWLATNDLRVLRQLSTRGDRPGPESTGPLEAHIRGLRGHLAQRAQTLRNRPRTNQLLRLLVAGRNGEADVRTWTEAIRSWLEQQNGTAPTQRQLVGAGGF